MTEIVETGATAQELEEAFACLHGNDDVMAEAQRPLSGRAAQIYDILAPAIDLDEEDCPACGQLASRFAPPAWLGGGGLVVRLATRRSRRS
ncbi:hypothetical protein [Rhodospirillaceae bacterium SYSU D60014]|uniref:hypothetical protein n=1 Tax=Virgifigura deserti TaxID=2268457 RepID=UPI000E670B37